MSYWGAWEIFGKVSKDLRYDLGISWHSPLDTLLWRVERKEEFVGCILSIIASHYSEFTSLGSCWERQNLHESSWVGFGCWSCLGCITTTISMLEAMLKPSSCPVGGQGG